MNFQLKSSVDNLQMHSNANENLGFMQNNQMNIESRFEGGIFDEVHDPNRSSNLQQAPYLLSKITNTNSHLETPTRRLADMDHNLSLLN